MRIRLQIAVGPSLKAEVIVATLEEAQSIWAKWCALRYARNEEMGGAVICMADLPRYFTEGVN